MGVLPQEAGQILGPFPFLLASGMLVGGALLTLLQGTCSEVSGDCRSVLCKRQKSLVPWSPVLAAWAVTVRAAQYRVPL